MLRSIPKAWGIRKLTNGICRPSTVLRNNHALSNYPRTTPSTRSAASRSFASSTLSSPSDPKSPIIEIPANLKGWLESSADIVSDQKDVVDLNRVKGMAATLPTAQGGETEGLKDGSRLREGWHLCLFQPILPTSTLLSDGTDTPFSPPSPFTQRMWASGSFTFNPDNPLLVGQSVSLKTVIDKAEVKKGEKTGEMVFAWKGLEVENEKGWSVREKRCHMYRKKVEKRWTGDVHSEVVRDSRCEATQFKPSNPKPSSTPSSDFSFSFHPTKIDLFRFSALTFNSHRIHYDSDYAREVEGYPDCLVHGPMTALLLLEILSRKGLPQLGEPRAWIEEFKYRATSPLVVGRKIDYYGKWLDDERGMEGSGTGGRRRCELWAVGEDGKVGMKGEGVVRLG